MPAVLLISDLDLINEILLEHSPFSQPPFVTANNVWGKGFPDVEGLNSNASDTVFKALEEIKSGKLSTASILITAQDGTGKSHIISRIRHRLQDLGGAFFILANRFSDLNQVKPGFQCLLAESLLNIGSQGVTQWQELATDMANDVQRSKNPQTSYVEAKNLVKRFEDNDDEIQIQKWVKDLTKGFRKLKTVQDLDIVRAIFWTLSDEQAGYASGWLGGKELAQYKADELGLPTQNQSFGSVLQILDIISSYNSLVICFDELDILTESNEQGWKKAQIVSNFVKELIENLHRGIILSVMMPGVWKTQIQENMPPAVSTKMTTYTKPLDLQYLNPTTTVELVEFFLKDYYESRNIVPPHVLYPFNEMQLKEVGKDKPTVREALKWCRENYATMLSKDSIENITAPTKINPVELAFLAEMGDSIVNSLDSNLLISDALYFSIYRLIGETVEKVTISEVTTAFGKRGGKETYLNFKIVGRDDDKTIGIAVSIIQDDRGTLLGAAVRKLLDSARLGLTRGCLIRSPEKPISTYIKDNYIVPLSEKGGEFVKLYAHEIKPLFALKMVHDKAESDYKVSDEQIQEFVCGYGEKYRLGRFNPLIREILSDPSYQTPLGLIDEPEVSKSIMLIQVGSDDEADNFEALDGLMQ